MNVEADETNWGDWVAEDDVKGGFLPPQLVRDARLKELRILMERQVYHHTSVKEAWAATKRKPLKLKWIDTDKGGKGAHNIRSRLVCTEVHWAAGRLAMAKEKTGLVLPFQAWS